MNPCVTEYSPAKIQYLLKEAGYTQKRIAQEVGKSEMIVSNVINFKRVSKEVMIAVAHRINADPKEVFGRNFDRAGVIGRPRKRK